MARTTATGRSPAAAASHADSRSTASAPASTARARSRPPASRSTLTTGPVLTASPARRSSPASSGADGHAVVVVPSVTSVATTRSPGLSVIGQPAAGTRDRQRAERILPEPPRLPPRAPRPVPANPDLAAIADPRPHRPGLRQQRRTHHQPPTGLRTSGRI